jgi:gluconate 2-dehydrogenase gamma chain
MPRLGRREALKLIGAAPLAVGFGVLPAEALLAQEKAAKAVKSAAKGHAYVPKFFNPHEWQTVRTLVDLIIPKDERSGSATDAGVPEFMDFLMADPVEEDRSRERRQTSMRGGLAWIDAECRHRFTLDFVACSDAQRTLLLDEIAHYKDPDDDEDALRDPRDLTVVRMGHGPAFFNSFRDLTASGFWSSKIGVADIGFMGNMPHNWQGPPPEVLRKLGLES